VSSYEVEGNMDKNTKDIILVVDDEKGVRQSFNMLLRDEYSVLLAGTGQESIEVFTKKPVDLVLLDILLPDSNGIELLQKFKETDPNVEIIMVTAVNETKTAVKAIKLGAYEYIVKPFDVNEVLTLIKRALEKRNLVKKVAYLSTELERYHSFEKMVGQDKKMKKIFELISTIAQSDGAVLIQGESGTGKELVARAIHNRGPRSEHPFIPINCAAIPSALMESELFGYNKGAFTSATSTHIGKLEIAEKGTVLLDDIDSLDINMQGKLLRIIQEKEFERLGSNKVIKADLRFISASNKNLSEMIPNGEFREDLFYRLNVLPINIPPLRERRGDIELLLNHFIELYAEKSGKIQKKISEKAINFLKGYDWPGNVRELQNLVDRLYTITKNQVIHIEDISYFNMSKGQIKGMILKEAVREFEKQYISKVLESVNGSRNKAAELLGVHRNTLLAKTSELNLDKKI
jgi:DNA-binding NtrC family response regulator